ncbi:acyl-CoA thioesterase [Cupriavidus necator]
MKRSTEYVLSEAPFVVRRTVRWADCDPAGVAYAGRFNEYLLSAVMHFMSHIGFAPDSQEAGIGLPCKHMSLTFHVSLYPDEVVDMRIGVREIRQHSFDLVAAAYLLDGRLAFEGSFSPVCIRSDIRERTAIPEALRSALTPYMTDLE